jgi:hypothetical protein
VSRKSKRTGAVALLAIAVLLGLWLWKFGGGATQDAVGPASAERSAPVLQTQPSELLPLPTTEREVAGVEDQPPAPDPKETRTIQLLVMSHGDGRPISGARVTAYEDGTDGGSESAKPTESESDADGRCVLRVADSTRPVRLKVEKEGFFHLNAFYERRQELTLRLAPTSTLSGRVLAADTNVPVPGARIRLPHDYCKRCEPDIVIADAHGRYELPGVPRHQEATFLLDAEGFASQWRRLELREDRPEIELDFRIERGTEIAGRVVDYTSGAGIPGAKLGEIQTDASGAFRGHVIPEEGETVVHLRVEAPGHCTLSGTLDPDQALEGLVFRLPRGSIVEGTVKDGHGAPIPAAKLRLSDDHRAKARAGRTPGDSQLDLPDGWRLDPEGYHSTARTDEQGRFRIENAVPASEYMELSVFADGYKSVDQRIARVSGPGERMWLELVLDETQPEGMVSGSIWLNGKPFRTATGRVRWKGASRAGDGVVHTGRFFMDVEPGELVFNIEVDGLSDQTEGTEFTLQVEPAAKIDHVVELRLPTRPIAGRVTFEDGGTAPQVSIDASLPLVGSGKSYWERLHVSAETAEDGSYSLDVPDVPSSYRVVASLDADEQSVEGVRPGASGVDFVLARSGVLLFRFRDALSDELLSTHDLELGWKRPGDDRYDSMQIGWDLVPDPDGWLEKRLPGGRLDLRASEYEQPRHVPTTVENVLIRPDEPLRVEFRMLPGKSSELLLASDQAPLPPRHTVLLVEADLWEEVRLGPDRNSLDGGRLGNSIYSRLVQFNQERRATIGGLGSGRFRFKVFPDDIELEPAEVEVGEATTEPVLVRWRKR